MNKQQRRAIIAQRILATAPENRVQRKPETRVSRNPALRVAPAKPLRTVMRKSSAPKMTPVQKDSHTGRKSLWSESPYVRPCTPEATPKWDWTVSSVAGR